MARPKKEGLEYFPLDVDIDQDDKLIVPIGKYGMEGFGIIIKLMMEIYKNGYCYSWTEKEQYTFSTKTNTDNEKVNAVVMECIKWGFFHKGIFEQYQVLTSYGFQKRFLNATTRRKETEIEPHFLLNKHGKVVSACNNPVNVDNNPSYCSDMSAISTQSKVKESKEYNTKSKTKFSTDHLYYKMALGFRDLVNGMLKREGIKKQINPNLQSWADEFRKLVELDKQEDIEQIKQVMRWVVNDDFWKGNCQSAKTFREKFTTLAVRMKAEGKPKQKNKQETDPAIMNRKKQEALQRWVDEGNDPDQFVYDGG